MTKPKFTIFSLCLLLIITLTLPTLANAADKMTLETVIARHLDSIGTPEARAAVGFRRAAGPTVLTMTIKGIKNNVDGGVEFASEGKMIKVTIALPDRNYPGEKFIFDGKKTLIGTIDNQNTRTPIGNFLFERDFILKDGLIGGSLSTAWIMFDPAQIKKMTFDGLKKVNGRDLLQITYVPSKDEKTRIRFFFEPDSYRHVLSIYSLQLASRGDTRYTMQEDLSDFKTVNGVSLPSKWKINFVVETTQNATIMNWDTTFSEMQ